MTDSDYTFRCRNDSRQHMVFAYADDATIGVRSYRTINKWTIAHTTDQLCNITFLCKKRAYRKSALHLRIFFSQDFCLIAGWYKQTLTFPDYFLCLAPVISDKINFLR